MSASAWSVALIGLEGKLVEIEAALGAGLPRTVIVGLPDVSINEAKERCKAAVLSAQMQWPDRLVTFNLSPAMLPKSGSHYDLGIVAALLAADGRVQRDSLPSTILMGELRLDGRVAEVTGVLPGLLAAVNAGFERAIVPASQVGEAMLVEGITVCGVATVAELIEVLNGGTVVHAPTVAPEPAVLPHRVDLSDVVGQPEGKWALEVAAAGRHHLYLHGAPGVGKTMLACRLPSLLPDLTPAEAIEVSAVRSLAGFPLSSGLMLRPPYSALHRTATLASLVGGGGRVIRPGAISLAHRGVLFLDEAPEFGKGMIEALRTPLELGWVTISRAATEARYPARFQLVMAGNPCPCGNFGSVGSSCHCTPMAVRRYSEKISGAILDRLDIQQRMSVMKKSVMALALGNAESSEVVAARVQEARNRQQRRLKDSGWSTNGEVAGSFLRKKLPRPDGVELLDDAVQRGRLSARGVDKVIRVAWTLADLAGTDRVGREQLHQALAMRQSDRRAAA